MMENTDHSQAIGSAAMPYLNELAHEYTGFTPSYDRDRVLRHRAGQPHRIGRAHHRRSPRPAGLLPVRSVASTNGLVQVASGADLDRCAATGAAVIG